MYSKQNYWHGTRSMRSTLLSLIASLICLLTPVFSISQVGLTVAGCDTLAIVPIANIRIANEVYLKYQRELDRVSYLSARITTLDALTSVQQSIITEYNSLTTVTDVRYSQCQADLAEAREDIKREQRKGQITSLLAVVIIVLIAL